MNRLIRLRDGSSIDVVGLVALVVLVGTIVFAATLGLSFYTFYKNPPTGVGSDRREASAAVKKFAGSTNYQVDMITGRSFFYDPPRPIAEAPAKSDRKPPYSGPQLVAYINGTAWFSDGQRVSSDHPGDKSLKLVRSSAPWTITVEYQGWEYDLELFKRADLTTLRQTIASTDPVMANPAPTPAPAPGASGSETGAAGTPAMRPGPGTLEPTPGSAPPPATAPPPASGTDPNAPPPNPNPGTPPAPSPGSTPQPAPGAPSGTPPPAPAPPTPAAPPPGEPQPAPSQPAPGSAQPSDPHQH